MALIRGLRGLCPCPKCLVLKDQLSDLTQRHENRTAQKIRNLLNEVATLSATDREKQLKQQGLRDVKVGMEIAKLSASIDLIYKERIF